MIKRNLFALLTVFLIGAAAVHAQTPQSDVAITLERTACFGTCPIYTVTIHDDGTVVYNGENFVTVTGEQTTQIDPATVTAMVQAFDNAGYFGWKEAYDAYTVTDMPSAITSVTRNGETHRINRYAGDSSAPVELIYLENWIDLMAGTGAWTGAASDVSGVADGSNTPLVTLQSGPCFGNCPVYNVALYDSGKVIYTGIANVSQIGVHVFQTDASAIAGITQQAQALGYLTWQDSYDKQVKTDQATVITSIRLNDQFKQITRYDGDPNAPVGLVWIEQSINQLVTGLAG